MNERIKELCSQAISDVDGIQNPDTQHMYIPDCFRDRFAELIVAECIDKIEAYQIPVGNSAAGEMACEWTYGALKEIRDEIKEQFGVEE